MESMDVSFNELSSADSPLASQPSVSPRINATKLFTKIVALEGRITSAITCEIAKAFEQFEQRMKIENEKLSEMLKKNENWAASIKKHVMAVEDSINVMNVVKDAEVEMNKIDIKASKNEDNVHVKEDGEIEKGSNEKDKIREREDRYNTSHNFVPNFRDNRVDKFRRNDSGYYRGRGAYRGYGRRGYGYHYGRY
jgi:hypothetical protein